jgi:asparagine synthetase B (glutamine-hydrolysing)
MTENKDIKLSEKMKNPHSKEFKERFLKVLDGKDYKDINSLYFSGGVDSTTILFSLLELGRKPDIVSFKQDGIPSEDVRIGREICEEYGIDYNFVEIPSDKDGIIKDVIRVIPDIEYPLKTHIQCSIPFMYMPETLVKLGHTKALTGLAAGDIFGLNKKTNMRYTEHGEEYVREMRWNGMNNPKLSDFDIWKVSEKYGIKMIDPYRDESICRWMIYDLPYKELHMGRPKSIVVDAFAEYWKLDDKKWYRPGDNLQIVSGIRERHDEILLNDSEVNIKNSDGIISVYRELQKEIARKDTDEWY